MSKKSTNEKLVQHQQISSGVTIVDGLNLAAIYTMFLHPVLKIFLESLAKYFLFPVAVVGSIAQAVLAWRQASLEKWKSRTVGHAVIETVTALAITTGVIGALAFAATFAAITPLIFVGVGAAKTIYHGGMPLYNDIKSVYARTSESQAKYRERAVQHGMGAAANFVVAGVAAAVFVLGKFALAAVGVACGLFIVGLGIYKGIKAYQSQQNLTSSEASLPGENKESTLDRVVRPQITNTLGMMNTLTPEGGKVTEAFKRKSDDTVQTSANESMVLTNQNLNQVKISHQEEPINPHEELDHKPFL